MANSPSAGDALQAQLLDGLLYVGSAWILYLLLALSIVSLAVAIERLVYFARFGEGGDALALRLDGCLRQGELGGGEALLAAAGSHVAEVAKAGLDALPRGPAAVQEVMAGASVTARLRLERGILFLGTLGNNAPFIGLFGTVLGIIRAFRDLGQNVGAGASAVMAGIGEALVTTAIGLLVALPAVALYNMLQRRVRVQVAGMDVIGHVVLAHAKAA